jgi:hypothetical protein
MMHPLIRKSSFAETIHRLNNGTNTMSNQKILWYPACGDDFRVLHHPVFNNVSINNDICILNDTSNLEEAVVNLINNNPDFEYINSYEINFPDLPSQYRCYYKSIVFDNGYVRSRKNALFLWGVSFEQLFELFNNNASKIDTIFIKRFNDLRITEEISNTMEILSTKYYINNFYTSGFANIEDYNESLVFARNNNLKLCQYSSYENLGHENLDVIQNVFVFER